MSALAWWSLRHRRTAFAATFLAVLLGTALTGSFATLIATAGGQVSDVDAETLVIMGAVVGGWGALIVLFSVASTVGITVRQRAAEIGLLRTVGATPRQARRMLRTEVLAVGVVAAALGAAIAVPGGRALLGLVKGGLVDESVRYDAGLAPVAAAAGVLVVSMLAAGIAGRRATRGPATLVIAEAGAESGRMRWWRVTAALLIVAYGLGTALVTITITADRDDPYAAMMTSGSSSILVGFGLALLAPTLLRWAAVLLRPLVGHGTVGHLAAYNTSRRAHLLAGVLGPVVVLAAAAIGIVMLVGIDGRTLEASTVPEAEADTITLLNNVVVGMICLFAAIMVVNAIVAVVSDRRRELDRLRLLGATLRQVRGLAVAEAAIVAIVGVVLGGLASLVTVVPFAVARDEGIVPDGQLWVPPLILAGTALLTLIASGTVVHRVTRQELLR